MIREIKLLKLPADLLQAKRELDRTMRGLDLVQEASAMRPLSYTQADACEYARRRRCDCRCGGELHGAARGISFDQLPKSDPHYTEAEPKSQEAREFIEKLQASVRGS